MLRSVASKMAWVGRTASMVFGLALVMALVFGVATTALSATGGKFILGKANAATTASRLTASVAGPALTLVNNSTAAAATALNVSVASGKAPLKVNAAAGTATGLSADELDGKSSEQFLGKTEKAADADKLDGKSSEQFANGVGGKATDADKLDGKDSSEFLGKTEKAIDADKLDGKDSAAFVLSDAVYNKNSGSLMSGQANGYVEHSLSCNPGDKLLSGSYSMWVNGSSPGSITNATTGFLVGRAEVRADSPERYLLGWHSDATPVNADLTVVCLDRG